MSNIRPVSDLRNYNEVLNACRESSPVYLTKKGRGKICANGNGRLRENESNNKIDG